MYQISPLYGSYKYFTVFNTFLLNGKLQSTENVEEAKFKFVVGIRQDFMPFCGGFLTALDTVITTATCLQEMKHCSFHGYRVYTNEDYYKIISAKSHQKYDMNRTFAQNKYPEYNFGLLKVRLSLCSLFIFLFYRNFPKQVTGVLFSYSFVKLI